MLIHEYRISLPITASECKYIHPTAAHSTLDTTRAKREQGGKTIDWCERKLMIYRSDCSFVHACQGCAGGKWSGGRRRCWNRKERSLWRTLWNQQIWNASRAVHVRFLSIMFYVQTTDYILHAVSHATNATSAMNNNFSSLITLTSSNKKGFLNLTVRKYSTWRANYQSS